MSPTITVSQELIDQIDSHRTDEETREEFLRELINHYEVEGNFLWEGYGGPP